MATFIVNNKKFTRAPSPFSNAKLSFIPTVAKTIGLAAGAAISNAKSNLKAKNAEPNLPLQGAQEIADQQSMLDTPVYSNLIFGSEKETSKNVYIDDRGIEQTFEPLKIDTVIMEVSLPKNIVKTQIQGRKGDFKQYVSSGDYVISVTGIITNDSKLDNIYPEIQVKKLVNIINIPDSIPVSGEFLNLFDIDRIIVDTDPRIFQEPGKRTTQAFSLTMISDTEIDLEEIETTEE